MTLVFVSQRVTQETRYTEQRDALDQRWHALFEACAITPLLVPNHLPLTQTMMRHYPPHGILLSGGNETPERNSVESFLLQYGIKHKIPILGVCHGMQTIQRYFKIPLEKISGHVVPEQEILIDAQPAIVNSYHDLGTKTSTPEFSVWAQAHDGIVKAIRHQSLPIIGIMWHPERLSPFTTRDITLIKNCFAKVPV